VDFQTKNKTESLGSLHVSEDVPAGALKGRGATVTVKKEGRSDENRERIVS